MKRLLAYLARAMRGAAEIAGEAALWAAASAASGADTWHPALQARFGKGFEQTMSECFINLLFMISVLIGRRVDVGDLPCYAGRGLVR